MTNTITESLAFLEKLQNLVDLEEQIYDLYEKDFIYRTIKDPDITKVDILRRKMDKSSDDLLFLSCLINDLELNNISLNKAQDKIDDWVASQHVDNLHKISIFIERGGII